MKCKCYLFTQNIYFRNTLSFSADLEIIAESYRNLLDNGVYYIGGPGFRENILPIICFLAPGNICDAATIVAGSEAISL